MKLFARMLVATLAFQLLAFAPLAAAAENYFPEQQPSGEAMVFDTLIMRPLGLLASVIGAATFIVSLPFSLPTGSADEAAQKLIAEPMKYTFARPLGDFEGR